MNASYRFHGDLPRLLRARWRGQQPLVQPVTRSASIKDVLEAFGLPHTEVDRITCNGRTIDFSWRVEQGQQFDIHPLPCPWDPTRPSLLRPEPLPALRFIADGNVGRLARYLRMAGLDTLYDPAWREADILAVLRREARLLLTRNLDLLKRRAVVYGRYVRASEPAAQLREILHLFALSQPPHPLSRCLECNTLLEPVAKERILDRLEPLTIRYFDHFHLCPRCDRIYWAGSHVDRMRPLLES